MKAVIPAISLALVLVSAGAFLGAQTANIVQSVILTSTSPSRGAKKRTCKFALSDATNRVLPLFRSKFERKCLFLPQISFIDFSSVHKYVCRFYIRITLILLKINKFYMKCLTAEATDIRKFAMIGDSWRVTSKTLLVL